MERHVNRRKDGLCPKCGERPRTQSGGYCNPCHAENMRAFRRATPLTPEQRRKDNCRSYSHVLLRRGKIEREPCKLCGREPAQMHHPDYNDPRRVEWLCRRCHKAHHDEERAGAR